MKIYRGLSEKFLNPSSVDAASYVKEDGLTADERKFIFPASVVIVCLLLGVLFVSCAHAYTNEEIVTAIGKAENSKSHPYGIMVKFKNTSPRQACLNTVRHKYRNWVKEGYKGDFIDYLASRYAPLCAKNDPCNLNQYWAKNVRFFLGRA